MNWSTPSATSPAGSWCCCPGPNFLRCWPRRRHRRRPSCRVRLPEVELCWSSRSGCRCGLAAGRSSPCCWASSAPGWGPGAWNTSGREAGPGGAEAASFACREGPVAAAADAASDPACVPGAEEEAADGTGRRRRRKKGEEAAAVAAAAADA